MTNNKIIQELFQDRGNSSIDYAKWEYAKAVEVYDSISNAIDLKHKKVLEIGCGFGGMSIYFVQKGIDLIAIDNNNDALEFAKEFASSHDVSVDFRFGDAQKLEFADNTFDAIIMELMFEHVENPCQVLKELQRILKPGGKVYNHFCLYYGPYGNHLHNFTRIPWIHLIPFLNLKKFILSKGKGFPKGRLVTPEHDFRVFETLNKITLAKTKMMLNKIGFKVLPIKKEYYDIGIGFGESISRRSFRPLICGLIEHIVHPFQFFNIFWNLLLNILSFLPFIGEFFLTNVTIVFTKKGEAYKMEEAGC